MCLSSFLDKSVLFFTDTCSSRYIFTLNALVSSPDLILSPKSPAYPHLPCESAYLPYYLYSSLDASLLKVERVAHSAVALHLAQL